MDETSALPHSSAKNIFGVSPRPTGWRWSRRRRGVTWEVPRTEVGQAYIAFGREEYLDDFRYRVAVEITDLASVAGRTGYLGDVLVVPHPRHVSPAVGVAEPGAASGKGRLPEDADGERSAYRALVEEGTCAPVYQCAGFWEWPESAGPLHLRIFSGPRARRRAWGWVRDRIEEEAGFVYEMLELYLDRPLDPRGTRGWDYVQGKARRPGPEGREPRGPPPMPASGNGGGIGGG